jgi:hypothetical protein
MTTTAIEVKSTFTAEGKTFDTYEEAESYGLGVLRLREATGMIAAALPKQDFRTAPQGALSPRAVAELMQRCPSICRTALEILHPSIEVQS